MRNGHKSQMEMKLLSLLTVKSDCDIWLRFKAKPGLSLNWFYSPSHYAGPDNSIPSLERVRSVQMGINWGRGDGKFLERKSYHAQRPPSWSLTLHHPLALLLELVQGGLSKRQVWEIEEWWRKQQLSPSIS